MSLKIGLPICQTIELFCKGFESWCSSEGILFFTRWDLFVLNEITAHFVIAPRCFPMWSVRSIWATNWWSTLGDGRWCYCRCAYMPPFEAHRMVQLFPTLLITVFCLNQHMNRVYTSISETLAFCLVQVASEWLHIAPKMSNNFLCLLKNFQIQYSNKEDLTINWFIIKLIQLLNTTIIAHWIGTCASSFWVEGLFRIFPDFICLAPVYHIIVVLMPTTLTQSLILHTIFSQTEPPRWVDCLVHL